MLGPPKVDFSSFLRNTWFDLDQPSGYGRLRSFQGEILWSAMLNTA